MTTLALVGAAVSVVAGASLAWASVPGPNGVIHACYNSAGSARIIDSSASCKSGETAIAWNQTGPSGPPGPSGEPGQSHAYVAETNSIPLAVGPTDPTVASVTAPTGSAYAVRAVIFARNDDVTTVNRSDGWKLTCYVFDQTPEPGSGFIVPITVHFSQQAEFTVEAEFTAASQAPFDLHCRTDGQLFIDKARIVATQVGALN